MQQLATIGVVSAVNPIAGADFIQQAAVDCAQAGNWSGVVGNGIRVGDTVLVFLQDAVLPESIRWAFMEKHKWRVRMARFKGVPSECVIVPALGDELLLPPGTSMSLALGVTKYEKPIPVGMQGDFIGGFPGFIPKTDEVNFQAAPELVERMHREPWYATEKADGTSCTVWNDETGMHVCSRNWELREFTPTGGTNVYWTVARKYGMERLPHGLALQFEVVGPGVQGNPMGLTELEARAFTLRDTRSHRYLTARDLGDECDALGMPTARFIGTHETLIARANHINGHGMPVFTADELRKLAEIKYPNGKHAEGIVIRAQDSSWSFKVLNLLYKF